MIISRIALLVAALHSLLGGYAQAVDYESLDPVVELRGIWLDAGAIPKTQRGIRDLMRIYKRANLNTIFPEVIARGYAVYPTRLLARDPRFLGHPDPLAALVREAHAQGIEVHPWVWVFRAGYTKDRGAILGGHPEWAELGKNGDALSPNGGHWISPANPAARDYLADVFAELVRNYDIDGLHLDYIRYEVEPKVPYGYSLASREAFRRQYGADPLSIEDTPIHRYQWQKFRERLVNTFVQRIALQTRSIKPTVKLSAAVGSDPIPARMELLQNWVNWVDNKWLDFVTPMAYSSDDKHFAGLVNHQIDAVGARALIAPGLGFFAQKTTAQMVRQIGIARERNADGQALFAASYFKDAQVTALAEGPYSRPAAVPFRDAADKGRLLAKRAADLYQTGDPETAAYYAARARKLADYACYQRTPIRYVRPTPPPIRLDQPDEQ